MGRTCIVTISAYSLVWSETRWNTRNWNFALSPRSIIVWPKTPTSFRHWLWKSLPTRLAFDFRSKFPFQSLRYDMSDDQGLFSLFLSCRCSLYSFFIKFMLFHEPLVLILDVYATSIEPFAVASSLFPSCLHILKPDHGARSMLIPFFLHSLHSSSFCSCPNPSLCPVFSQYPFWTRLPWNVLDKFLCIQQAWYTAMRNALIRSPDVWAVELLHAVVVSGTTLVVRARDWKSWRKGPSSTPSSIASHPGENLTWSSKYHR